MTAWERIADARVREWLRRPEKDRSSSSSHDGPVVPLELQLIDEILALLKEASACADAPRAAALRKQADGLQTRLLVVLEDSGRPLAAQHFARLLAEARARK